MAAFAVIVGGLWLAFALAGDQPSVLIPAAVLALVAVVALGGVEDRLVRRWLASRCQYFGIKFRLVWLVVLGLLVHGLYRIAQHGDDLLDAVGVPAVLLIIFLHLDQQGPARGRSGRKRAGSARNTFARRHPQVRQFGVRLGIAFGFAGGSFAIDWLSALAPELSRLLFLAGLALAAALGLRAIALTRREKKTLGFDPDLYLAVARRVGEENRRPELLVHQPSQHPNTAAGTPTRASRTKAHARSSPGA